MSVYTEILAQFNQMMAEFSNNPQLWQDFLKNVCRNYKLRFDEQVLLFAQQPNAIAVGTFDQWFHLYRPVAKGSPAINVFEDYYGKSRRYKRYYEISDTITLANSRPINIWTMQEEYQQSVAETLESDFGKTNAKTFEELIILSAENIVNENLTDYNTNILNAVEGSFLEDLGSDAVLSIYRRIVTSSVAYSMLSRLGYKADSYIDPDEFSEIVNFDTISTMMCLGEATQHMTKIGITSAANSITKYNRLYKEADNENLRRNDSRGENRIQPEDIGKRRTTADRTQTGGTAERILQQEKQALVRTGRGNVDIHSLSDDAGRRGTQDGQILNQQTELSQRKEVRNVRTAEAGRQSEQTSQRASGEVLRERGTADRADVQKRGSELATSADGLVEVRADEREHLGTGKGNGHGGNGLRLNDIENSKPTITCEWSESNVFEDGKTYSVAEFDRLMAQADAQRVAETKAAIQKYGSAENWYNSDAKDEFTQYYGYDKVKFTVNMPDGRTITERQDIGDGNGGVIDFLKQYSQYSEVVGLLETDIQNNDIPYFRIYQMNDNLKYHGIRFQSYADNRKQNAALNSEDYNLIYEGKWNDIEGFSAEEKLENIFKKFNTELPLEFKGHSLSVSDVVTVGNSQTETAYYVDRVGYSDFQQFFMDKNTIMINEYMENHGDELLKPTLAFDEEIAITDEFFNFEKAWHNVDSDISKLAERYRNGEDIRIDLAKYFVSHYVNLTNFSDYGRFEIHSDDNGVTIQNGEIFKSYTWNELGEHYASYIKDTFISIQAERVIEYPEIRGEVEQLITNVKNEPNPENQTANVTEKTLELEKYIDPPKAEIEENSTSAFLLPENENTDLSSLAVPIENDDIYSDRFFLFEDAERVDWMYYDPDGNDGNGQYVTIQITFEDITNANMQKTSPEGFFDYLNSTCRTYLSDTGTIWYEEADAAFNEIPTFTGCTDETMKLLIDIAENSSPQKEKIIEQSINTIETQDFHITDYNPEQGTQKEKFRANIAAIQLLKKCLEENRYATPKEQEILAKYVGWGGLSDAFDETNSSWNYEYFGLKTVLTEEEYNAARQSSLTAFYTPPIVIKSMYDVLESMGFANGNILEPSCGVGSFIGMIPTSMQESKIYGVELDNISAGIAAQLYRNAKITNTGFEETSYPDNFFDVVIGNIPFGDIRVNDRRYNKHNFLIHDYFFAKSIDKVRPGGIVALITSKGTMDKKNPSVRKYIAQRAELLGAIRLPDDTFKRSAGTEVTSDIIFLQKRDKMIDIEPDWVHLDTDENGITMNSYFVNNPEMILGEMKTVSGPYGAATTCSHIEGTELEALLSRAAVNIKGTITNHETLTQANDIEVIPADPSVRNYSFTVVDGAVYVRENSVMVKQNVKGMAEKRIKALMPIRDCTRHLIELQVQNYPDETIKAEQAHLNALYDKFTAEYGRIRSRGNYAAFKEDCSYSLLSSLEKVDDDGNFTGKADIFFKRTILPHIPVTHVNTSQEALAVSLGEKACVDIEYMCSLTNKTEEEIYSDLVGSVFLNPLYSDDNPLEHKYLPKDEYLSGNVRKKLQIAQLAAEADSAFNINVTALKDAQPKDLSAAEISVKLGTTWIDEKYIEQFMRETFDLPFWTDRYTKVRYSNHSGAWSIEGKSSYSNVKTESVYGTKRMNAFAILESSLNLKEVKVMDYFDTPDGKRHSKLNEKETQIAQEKQKQLKQAFQDWIWKDPDRREDLTKLYNERFNSDRLREYDGSNLVFAGMNPEITLRPHQKNAVARIIYGGNTLLAHVVGAGKTFEIVAAAQESKRLGLCTKSLIVVPKHLTEQWGTSYLQLYPAANILVSRQEDFSSAERRKRFCSRIATGDYDAVIIGQTQFERLKMSVEYQKQHIEKELDEITTAIIEAKAADFSRFSVKDLERTKKNLTVMLEKLNNQEKKDEGITFEELGVDRLFVDEAHYYKNLYMYTKMQNVKGINTTAAEKSSDMLMKVRYIDELTNGRGVIFATGTPISNSMVEMYTMQRYLQYNGLKSKGIASFDAWAGTFGETVSDYELKPEGQGYQLVTRFAKFTNIPELLSQFRMIADVQTADMLSLDVPDVERHNVVLQRSEHQEAMIEALAKRANDFRNGKKKDSPQEMLLITNEGRKLALDQRIIDSLLPDYEDSKTSSCAENIMKIYRETSETKGTQLVFCDLSTPKNKGEFNVYDDLKTKLIDKGIPSDEIKFIHEAGTDKAKDELFSKVRNGTVRVLIGSTQKMGAGTNVQDKLIALHHLDCPWTPASLEQREGRIIRQGNSNTKVHIYTYVTEGTFDAFMYGTLARKQRFISQIMTGKMAERTCEDVDERTFTYSEIMAVATGNPMIKEAAELERDISILTTLRTNFYNEKYSLEDNVNKNFPQEIALLEKTIKGLKHDISVAEQHPKPSDGFVGMTLYGTYYSDKEKAGDALLEALKSVKEPDVNTEIGEYRGFTVMIQYNSFTKSHKIKLKAELTQTTDAGESAVGNIQRMDNILADLPERLIKVENSLQDTKNQLETAKIECKKEFPKEQELRDKIERLNEIRAELNDNAEKKESINDTKTMQNKL